MKKNKLQPTNPFPTEEKREYVTIAGSGPSARTYNGRVDVATKKVTVPCDYAVARWSVWWSKRKDLIGDGGFMCYKPVMDHKRDVLDKEKFYQADHKYWDAYFLSFKPTRVTKKPSTGLCAVFCAYERWMPERVGLIGFDWVLDGDSRWSHDPDCELRCIRSLVDIVDLRTGNVLEKQC